MNIYDVIRKLVEARQWTGEGADREAKLRAGHVSRIFLPVVMLCALAEIGGLAAGTRLVTWEQYAWVSNAFVTAGTALIWRNIAGRLG